MITYHQIREMMQMVAQQSRQFQQLHEALASASRLSDRIEALSQELESERNRMSHEFRSVEVLEEILAQHVFGQSTPDSASAATIPSPQGSQHTVSGLDAENEMDGDDRHHQTARPSTRSKSDDNRPEDTINTPGPVMF